MGYFKELYETAKFTYRRYAAAKNSPTLGPLGGMGKRTVNEEVEVSWDDVTERQLQLVRDMPIFAGAVSSMESFIVGDGIKPQWNVLDSRGNPDKKTSQMIEDRFMDWAMNPTRCDLGGRLTLFDMQRLAVRMEAEFGEYLFLESVSRDGGYNLSAIEPSRLADPGFHILNNKVGDVAEWRGLKYNVNSMKVLSYIFDQNPDVHSLDFNLKEVPADRVIHGFKHVRAGQLRGITEFASAILSAHMLKDYMNSELTAQNLSSRWMAWVTAPASGVHSAHNSSTLDYNEFYNKYVDAMDYASIQYLKNGEQINMNTQQRQANGFKNFNEIIIRYISAASGLPYELLSQDYSGLNFTTLRGVRNDFKQHLRPRWQRLITHFCDRSADKWLRAEVMSGRLKLAGYFTNPERYHRKRWITPALEQVDPLKEFNAELNKVNAGMKSPQEVIKSMGGDPDKVLQEQVEWKERLEENGLTFMGLSSANVNIANFDIIEEEEQEDTAPVDQDRSAEVEIYRDQKGKLYKMVDGVCVPVKI